MIRFVLLFLLFSVSLFSIDRSFTLDREAEPSSFIFGVNAITGAYLDVSEDIVLQGPEPLSFTRYYNSAITRIRTNLGIGHSTFPHFIENIQYEKNGANVSVEEIGGSYLRFFTKDKDWGSDYYLAPDLPLHGLTNCGGMISGKSNYKNIVMHCQKRSNRDTSCAWTVVLGDGTKRFYSENKLLSYEIRPTGNKVIYEYDQLERPSRISTTDSTGHTVFNWLAFSYDNKGNTFISASNGKTATCHVASKTVRLKVKVPGGRDRIEVNYRILDSVESSSQPYSKYSYHTPGDRISNEMAFHLRPDGRYLHVGCTDHTVRWIKQPCGKNGAPIKVINFDYRKNNTEVMDCYQNRSTYYYTPAHALSKVTRYIKFKKGHVPYSSQVFFWDEPKKKLPQGVMPTDHGGFLVTKGLTNNEGRLIRATHLTYDDRGNVIKETINGNLSGKILTPNIKLSATHYPEAGDFESYSCEKTYSDDGFNLILTEKEDNGLYTEYTYRPGTNLLTSKTIHNDGSTIRHLFEYDAYAILTKKIVEDGAQRKIVTISPRYSTPGFGQPEIVTESYFDFKKGVEVTLKKGVYTYGPNDKPIQEDVFDAEGVHCYSIYTKYDAHDNIIEQVDALGIKTLFGYDANDNKIYEEKIGSGYKLQFKYDLLNRCISQEETYDDLTQTIHIEYDMLGRKIASTDYYGNVTKFTYDEFGREIQVEYPSVGNKISIEKKSYSLEDNLIAFTDREGNTTYTDYNYHGKPVKITYPDKSEEKFEYYLNGLLQTKWQKSGACAHYNYDTLGRLIQEITLDENGFEVCTQNFEYNGQHLSRSYDKMGNCTEYEYDGAGRKTAQTRCGKEKTTFEYDSLGRPCKTSKWISSSEAVVQLQFYDVLNRVIEERSEDLFGKIYSKVTFKYDINGNKIETNVYTSPTAISTTKTVYNSRNEIVEEMDPLGNVTYLSYNHKFQNSLGQYVLRKKTVDPLGNQILETFDGQQNLVSKETLNPHEKQTSFVEHCYDNNGREVLQINSVIVEYEVKSSYQFASSYDSMGNIIQLKEMDKITQYTYDQCGRLLKLIKPDGVSLEHVYDCFGHLLTLTSSDASIDYAYIYDLNDHLLQVIDHGKPTSACCYNDLGQLTKEHLANGFDIQYVYDAISRPTEIILPDSTSVRYIYEGFDLKRIERYRGSVIYFHEYIETDWIGNPIHTKLVGNAGSANFTYNPNGNQIGIRAPHYYENILSFDAAGNILEAEYEDPIGFKSTSYAYDDLYQLTKESDTTYAYDSINNRLCKDDDRYKITPLNQVASTSFSEYAYDKNGNLTQDSSNLYTYDALNRLIASNGTTYTYDSSGRRMSKNDVLFIYQNNCEIGSYESGDLTLRVLGKGREADVKASVAIETQSGIYAPIHDHRGNIVLLINSKTGLPSETLRYDAFGLSTLYGPDITPWQFSSKRFDKETNFVYFSNRYYIPNIGRWLTTDPLGFADGPNLYAFVHNSPIIFFDPYGLLGIFDDVLLAYNGFKAIDVNKEGLPNVHNLNFENFFDNKSRIFSTGTHEFKNIGIGHVNGIDNSPKDSLNIGEMLSKMIGGYKVNGVYNATHGKLWDILECGLGLNHFATEPVHLIHKMWDNFFDNHDNDARFLMFCHSHGAILTTNALLSYPEERRKRIHVVGIAPAAYIYKDTCEQVTHYRVEAWRDFIPRIDQAGAIRSRDTIKTLRSSPMASLHDHAISSPTYVDPIRDSLNKFIDKYERAE